MKTLWNFVWPIAKSHLSDKAMWVTILGFVLSGLNKWLKLGLDDTMSATIVTGLAAYLVTHLAHSNTINKDNTNA